MGKIKFCGLLIVGLAFLMSSCLGNDDTTIDDWNLGNAQISTFSLSNDSIEGLSDVVFTIDQLNGKIYNRDSMPYGTVIDEKVICSISYEFGALGTIFVSSETGDTVYWNGSDSVDFSSPVLITVYPYDGVSTKTYEAWINIHQVNPDSMVWELYSGLIPGKSFSEMKILSYNDSYYMYAKDPSGFGTGVECKLYRSETSDMVKWEQIPLTGMPENTVLSRMTEYESFLYTFTTDGELYRSADGRSWSQVEDVPYIQVLIGSIPEIKTGGSPVLSGISKVDETLRFVVMNENMEWQTGTVVPASFPLSGFDALNYEAMYYPYLSISGGRDSEDHLSGMTWSTMNGLSWISITNEQSGFSSREGPVFFSYDDTLFYLIGGLDASGAALKDVYYSKDRGVTWWQDTVHIMPEDYSARGFSSVIIDKDNFILLFGGKVGKDTNILNELWRGRINRLGFRKD
ncbi:MAG: DUF6242 domain-containing protein [Tannerella sp.]|jgi:hypothetical protein|nr:DUF6242 domain-containing protein [Tannerella sp.]